MEEGLDSGGVDSPVRAGRNISCGLGSNSIEHAARKREQLQWEREIGEKRRLERLDAYEEFASLTMEVALAGEHFNSETLLRSLHRVEMRFSPSTGELAFNLYKAAINVLEEAQKPEAKQDKQKYDRRSREWGEARDKFVKRAREEIASSESSISTTPIKALNQDDDEGYLATR